MKKLVQVGHDIFPEMALSVGVLRIEWVVQFIACGLGYIIKVEQTEFSGI